MPVVTPTERPPSASRTRPAAEVAVLAARAVRCNDVARLRALRERRAQG